MTRFFFLPFLFFCTLLTHLAQSQQSQSEVQNGSEYARAMELYHQKKFAAARKAFETFLNRAPGSPHEADALYFRAVCGLSLFHADGEQLFDDFLEQYPDHPRALAGYYEIGNFYYREENYEKASDYFSKAKVERLNAPKRDELYFHWGYALFNLKKFDEALAQFDKIKTTPGEWEAPARYYAGYLEFKLGKPDLAMEDLLKAGESEGYDIIVPELLSAILYSQKKYKELINFSTPFLSGAKEAKNKHEIALYAGDAYYELKEYSKAVQFYEQYMKASRKKPVAPVLFRISFSYMQTENTLLAIENFKYVALEKDTLGQAASYYLGDLYIKENNKNFAVSAYQQASELDFDRKVQELAMFKLAQVHLDLGSYDQAIQVLERFSSNFSSSVNRNEVRDMMAEAFVNSNNYDGALAYFEKVGLNSQRTRTAYQKAAYLKGTQQFNNGNFSQALEYFNLSLKYPSDAEFEMNAWFWKGEAYSTGRKLEDAAACYQQVLQRSAGRFPEIAHKANYGMGYALFNQKKYPEAAAYFKAYTDNRNASNYRDAAVRLADCLFAQKRYEDALRYYKQSLDDGFRERDYVLHQRGLIFGFQNKKGEAKTEFAQLVKSFPASRYADDALYQSAQLDFEAGEYSKAKSAFSNLIDKHPSSSFVPYALVRRASSSFNLKDYPATASDYKQMLEVYPQHPLANGALLGLQEVLGLMGKPEEMDEYLSLYKQANPGDEAIESVEYERARNLYFDQKYDAAISTLKAYRAAYPESHNSPEALYYVGDSYFRNNQPSEALGAFYELSKKTGSVAASKIYQKIASLESAGKNYGAALPFWHRLKAVADNKRDEFTAREGLMETHFMMQNLDSSGYYAELILSDEKVSFNAQNKAGLFLGKIAFLEQRNSVALDEFLAVVNAARDVNAAEAQYYVGLIQYNQKDYRRSLETLFSLNKSYSSYQLWLGNSFLLIADNYMALNELFQAKATLESVLANSPLVDIKQAASKKLQEVQAREKAVLTQKDSLSSPLKSDSISRKSN